MNKITCPACHRQFATGSSCPFCGYDLRARRPRAPRQGVDYVGPVADNPNDDPEAPGRGFVDEAGFLFPNNDPVNVSAVGKKKKKRLIATIAVVVLLALAAFVIIQLNHDSPEKERGAKEKLLIGRTWTVDGQWSLTINSVTKTDRRSPLNNTNDDFAEIYIIEYSYANLDYRGDNWGLFFSLSSDAKDSTGATCLDYSFDDLVPPDQIEPGQRITCRQAIAVYNEGGFSIVGTKYSDKNHGTLAYQYEFVYYN